MGIGVKIVYHEPCLRLQDTVGLCRNPEQIPEVAQIEAEPEEDDVETRIVPWQRLRCPPFCIYPSGASRGNCLGRWLNTGHLGS